MDYTPKQLVDSVLARRDEPRSEFPMRERLQELLEATRNFLRGRSFRRISLCHVLHERQQDLETFIRLRTKLNQYERVHAVRMRAG